MVHLLPRVLVSTPQVQGGSDRFAERPCGVRWHDIGLKLVRNRTGATGYEVIVDDGQGRMLAIGTTIRSLSPPGGPAFLHRGNPTHLQPLRTSRQQV